MKTYRKLLTLLAAALCAASLHAQVGDPRRGIAVGVNAGLNLNQVGFDPTIRQYFHLGPTAGVTARFDSELYFRLLCSLQVELNYSQLGWNEEILNAATEPLPDTYQRHLHYLQLPLLARLALGKEGGVMGYLVAGPQFGFLVGESAAKSATWTLNGNGEPDRPNGMFAQYAMDVEKKLDYGITAGLGVELCTKAGRFQLEGRYYYGLSDLYGNSKKDVFGRSNNGTIVAKITYLFDLRR